MAKTLKDFLKEQGYPKGVVTGGRQFLVDNGIDGQWNSAWWKYLRDQGYSQPTFQEAFTAWILDETPGPGGTTIPPVINDVGSIRSPYTVGSYLSLIDLSYTALNEVVIYQWKKDGINIAGETSDTYLVDPSDDGSNISLVITVANSAGSDSAETASVPITYTAPTKTGDITPTELQLDASESIDYNTNLIGEGGSWSFVSGTLPTGMSHSNGIISGTPTAEQSPSTVILRYTNSGGFVDISCSISVVNPVVAPVTTNNGSIDRAVIGSVSTYSGFAFTGSGVVTYQWTLGGINIAGATSSTYTPIESQDTETLTCVATVTNSAGSDTGTASGIAVTYNAPTSAGNLSNTLLTSGMSATINYEAQITVIGDADLSGGVWSVQSGTVPSGMTRTGGIVSGTPDTPQSASDLILRYTNSGGFVDVTCSVTVQSTTSSPTLTSVGTISGTGVAGTEQVISGATATGESVLITYQWTASSSGDIAGATATTFVPGPELDGQDIDCKVTASNFGGSDTGTASGPTCSVPEVALVWSPTDKDANVVLDTPTSCHMTTNALTCVRTTDKLDNLEDFCFSFSWPASTITSTAYIGVSDPTSALNVSANPTGKDYIAFVGFDGRYDSPDAFSLTGGITPNLTGGDTVRVAIATLNGERRMYVGTSSGWIIGDPEARTGGLRLPKTVPLAIHCCPRSANQTVFTLHSLTSDLGFTPPTGFVSAGRALSFRKVVKPKQADNTIEKIGINLHFANGGTAWQDSTAWHQPLVDLGIRYGRTNVSASSVTYGLMNQFISSAGMKYLCLGAPKVGSPVPTFPSTNMTNGFNAVRDNVGAANVIGWEGGNEVNDGADAGWETRTNDATVALKALRDADMPAVPIIAPTVYRRSVEAMTALGDQSSLAEKLAVHIYSGAVRGPTGTDWSSNALAPLTIVQPIDVEDAIIKARELFGINEAWITEFGIHQQGDGAPTTGLIADDVAANYLLRILCEYDALSGVEKMFIYSLFDDLGVNNYGLLGLNNSENFAKRQSYYTIQRFIDLLEDPGSSFTPTDFPIYLSGDIKNIRSSMWQKRDGTYYLALWQQAVSWNDTTHTQITIPDISVNVGFSKKATQVRKWQPSIDGSVSLVGNNVNSFSAAVPDYVVIYEITTTPVDSGTPAEVLTIESRLSTPYSGITPSAGNVLFFWQSRTSSSIGTVTSPFTLLPTTGAATYGLSLCYVIADGVTAYTSPYTNTNSGHGYIIVDPHDSTFNAESFVSYTHLSGEGVEFGDSVPNPDLVIAIAGVREAQTDIPSIRPSGSTSIFTFDDPGNFRDISISSSTSSVVRQTITPSVASQSITGILSFSGSGYTPPDPGGTGNSFYNASTDPVIYLNVDLTQSEAT